MFPNLRTNKEFLTFVLIIEVPLEASVREKVCLCFIACQERDIYLFLLCLVICNILLGL